MKGERHGRQYQERILEVSLELFAQSGYLGTSMSDIAKQLGITNRRFV